MAETAEEMLAELKAMKLHIDQLHKRILETTHGGVQDEHGPLDIDEMRETLSTLLEKQEKLESTFGIEKVCLKDVGDRIQVTIDTNFGTLNTHAEKLDTHTPVTFSGSTVAGGMGGQAPTTGGGKASGPPGMTSEQLQDFKKQSLQISAAQQKLKELETKLNEAAVAIKKGNEKTFDMEEKEAETTKELYACIDSINTSLSEKIALQKVEVQKIAGDTPKPINYDPFNYGEAYAGDLVDFQARKRIIELKLLMQGLQAALLQMRDQMKVSPNIDLGYKVVRLDQLVASTGFGQMVQKGEVAADEAMVVEQSAERTPGKIDYPRKSVNQISPGMESKWAITDSIMQTMYRLEMELGELQKCVDGTGMSSGGKLIEELQQTVKQLKDRQLDIRTVKRIIEESKDTSNMNLAANRARPSVGNRSTLASLQGNDTPDASLVTRKFEQALRQMHVSISNIQRRLSSLAAPTDTGTPSAMTRSNKGSEGKTKSCVACDRIIKPDGTEDVGPSIPIYSYFSPLGAHPRIRGPTTQLREVNRTMQIQVDSHKTEQYTIPRPCGAGYARYWPLPTSFDASKFINLVDPPALISDTRYIKGRDGKYYRSAARESLSSHQKREVPFSILEARLKDGKKWTSTASAGKRPQDYASMDPVVVTDDDAAVAVVVSQASDEGSSQQHEQEEAEMAEDRERSEEVYRRASQEMKKYKFKMKDPEGEEDGEGSEGSPGGDEDKEGEEQPQERPGEAAEEEEGRDVELAEGAAEGGQEAE